jgi:predicted cobalt transporter CbtA
MEKRIIGLGLCGGLLAGLVTFTYARLYIAPLIDAAIDYESARSSAEAAAMPGEHTHEHEVFTRAVQENIGAAAGTVVFALIVGALFAVGLSVVLSALKRHRVNADPRTVAVLVAAGAFVCLGLVPLLACPANPPGVGQADTAGARTTAFLIVVVASLTLAATALTAALRAAPRIGGWVAAVSATAGYLAAVTVLIAVVPTVREVPGPLSDADGTIVFAGFPAELLADFRVAALLSQALLWSVLAATFAVAMPRILPAPQPITAQTTAGTVHADR